MSCSSSQRSLSYGLYSYRTQKCHSSKTKLMVTVMNSFYIISNFFWNNSLIATCDLDLFAVLLLLTLDCFSLLLTAFSFFFLFVRTGWEWNSPVGASLRSCHLVMDKMEGQMFCCKITAWLQFVYEDYGLSCFVSWRSAFLFPLYKEGRKPIIFWLQLNTLSSNFCNVLFFWPIFFTDITVS